MSLLSIICLTGPSAALFVKSCWLCRLIPSCRQPEMAVCPRLDAVFSYPSLCIKRRYGYLVHAHSVHLLALTPQDFHLVHELLPLTERFFVVLVRYLLLNHIFFHALRLPYVVFAHFHRVHLRPHCYDFLYHFSPTFIFPKTFLFLPS